MKLTLLFFLFGLASFYQSKAQQSSHRLPLDENILLGKTQANEGIKWKFRLTGMVIKDKNGSIIGAVGSSGGTVEQDKAIAEAGAKVLA